jgi:hypothetical protein
MADVTVPRASDGPTRLILALSRLMLKKRRQDVKLEMAITQLGGQ